MDRRVLAIVLALAVVGMSINVQRVAACPFCAAVSQTFSEEITAMDAVVIARLVKAGNVGTSGATDGELAKSKFEIEEAIKGKELLGDKKTIETVYFGEAKIGQQFLLLGVDPPNFMWSAPLALSDRGKDYIKQLTKLPANGTKRLEFFQGYLEDEDEMLARDAYDEFANAPYAEVIALKEKMNHDQLVAWIKNDDIPASRRRLYLTMLGVCGKSEDLMLLEGLMRSEDRKDKAGLDALVACYLTLKGADGMPLVEELFLKNKNADYADTYAAIMALRFHGSETDVIPRKRLVEGLRHMLDRPQLADLVIPDLARWEDWESMQKLVTLFKEADEKSSWVRVPVINYLRACPSPKAKEHIKELEKIDPDAVKRANTFFPFGPPSAPADGEQSGAQRPKSKQPAGDSAAFVSTANELVAAEPTEATVSEPPAEPAPAESIQEESIQEESTQKNAPQSESIRDELPTEDDVAAISASSSPPALAAPAADSSPNLLFVLGVPLLGGVMMMGLIWIILRGGISAHA